MVSQENLRSLLETEERETVGTAFGGTDQRLRKSYSIARIRDWILADWPYEGTSEVELALRSARDVFSRREFSAIIADLIRFSFLIELTNLKVGSTKMKTRWLSGKILMSQPGSFEPVEGNFEPGNDPRSATFDECTQIFIDAINMVCDLVDQDPSVKSLLKDLVQLYRVPYEFPLSYWQHDQSSAHQCSNIRWIVNEDLEWLLKARRILKNASGRNSDAIRKIENSKLNVKLFKTDRALTGKDKTNRARRWEVLSGDFQHAPLEDCWSAERKLTADLVSFTEFPSQLREEFVRQCLVEPDTPTTKCPVTFEPLKFHSLARAVLEATHGVSEYQIGHLRPLKRGGKHDGTNICWQSADGNWIQGDLSVEETHQLLDQITARRAMAQQIFSS